jgi:hypothetical protein
MVEKPRRAVPAFRVSSAVKVPVRVQFLGKGLPVYPEFSVQPGGNNVTIHPTGFDTVQLWSSRPRIARFMTCEHGF